MAELIPVVWNDESHAWNCANCGHTEFWQTVMATNYVTLSSGDATTLIESDDFEGSWEVTERSTVVCGNCTREVALPDTVNTVERCQWQSTDDDDGDEMDVPMKW